MPNDPGYTLDEQLLKLVRETVRRVLGENQGEKGDPASWQRLQPFRIAKVVTQVSARSGNTPGTGEVEFYHFDIGGTGDLTNTSVTNITVYNVAGATVAVDKWVGILQDERGIWWVILEDCS